MTLRAPLFALLAVACLAAAALAADPVARALSDERWIDRSFGISLLPPVGTRTMRQTADDYLMRLADDEGQFTMSLSVKKSKTSLTLRQVAESAKLSVARAQPTSRLIEEKPLKVQERAVLMLYFEMPQAKGVNQLIGQAITQLDAQNYALLEIRCDIGDAAAVRPTFEAVVATLDVVEPELVNQQRADALQMGGAWRRDIGVKDLHDAIIPEQLFRLVEGTKELGYMRVRQSLAKRDNVPGIRVDVQTRIVVGPSYYDSLAQYFLADDDTTEFWNIITTQRPIKPPALKKGVPAPPDPTTTETGIRDRDDIMISVTSPDGNRNQKLKRPKAVVIEKEGKEVSVNVAYLSQVETLMLPQLLPIDRPGTYGFYWYHSRRGTLTYRTEQVVPALTGITVETRLSTNEAPLRTSLNTSRRIVQKQLGTTVKLHPTTAAELSRIWPAQ